MFKITIPKRKSSLTKRIAQYGYPPKVNEKSSRIGDANLRARLSR